jgi:hypothetical protein
MRKSTITRVWLGGLAGIAGGVLAFAVGTILMLGYGGTYGGPSGSDFVPTMNASFWWMVGLVTLGALALVAGAIAQVVAWIGALVNTYALAEKTWFTVLLIGGLIGIFGMVLAGFVTMVVYLMIGPDTSRPATGVPIPATPPVTLAPAS